ncbi:hypothetical protein BDV96DRAFT_201191 [Lophiotrema nucula]|uniref:Uncharacterized protein n=1 Tax=Lophiotrema nucula TaxID=690887 RepID=A0A6A5YTA3_9PLEO|nr:hypothetical protein BDV96DRAFT_201191 [Lophiotrema nucula]
MGMGSARSLRGARGCAGARCGGIIPPIRVVTGRPSASDGCLIIFNTIVLLPTSRSSFDLLSYEAFYSTWSLVVLRHAPLRQLYRSLSSQSISKVQVAEHTYPAQSRPWRLSLSSSTSAYSGTGDLQDAFVLSGAGRMERADRRAWPSCAPDVGHGFPGLRRAWVKLQSEGWGRV